VKPRVPSTYAGINFDPEFLLLLTSPIRRGDSYGVVGNGMILVKGLALMEEAKILGRLPDGWQDTMRQTMVLIGDENVPRYHCPKCTTTVI
jgi:hypothetical protein